MATHSSIAAAAASRQLGISRPDTAAAIEPTVLQLAGCASHRIEQLLLQTDILTRGRRERLSIQ
jgi:hypothetical protein